MALSRRSTSGSLEGNGDASIALDRVFDRARTRSLRDLGTEVRSGEGIVRRGALGDRRLLAQALAFVAAGLLVLAGIALWAHGGWWRPTAVVGLALSTVLLLLYFNPWYLFILAVNLALMVGIGWLGWPSKATVGA
jgi:hypothetical protein